MCMQCMASAMTAVGAASGTRAYLGSRRYAWLTPKRLRAITLEQPGAALHVSDDDIALAAEQRSHEVVEAGLG